MPERNYVCPICKKPASREDKHFPFCSARCKTIDLGAWASESYVISRPITEADENFKNLSEQKPDSAHE